MDTPTPNQAELDLLKKLSLSDLAEDKKNEILQQLDELVETRVALAISEKLSEEANTQLDNMVETSGPEQILNFIKQHIPDYDEMVGKIAEDTIDELANNKDAVLAEVGRLREEAKA